MSEKKVQPVPAGYRTVTPYLVVADAAGEIEFIKAGLSGTLVYSHTGADGSVSHAEMKIGDSMVMLGQASEKWKPLPCAIYLYVEDCDALYAQAVAAGAKSTQEPTTHFYGDRGAGVLDSNGVQWWIGTHVEDVPPEEIARRAQAAGR
jgi:PhnB protein